MRPKPKQSSHDVFRTKIEAARRRSESVYFNGYVGGYCANDCPVRGVTFRMKYMDAVPKAIRCPVCSAELRPGNEEGNLLVRTTREEWKYWEDEARASVANQVRDEQARRAAEPYGLVLKSAADVFLAETAPKMFHELEQEKEEDRS